MVESVSSDQVRCSSQRILVISGVHHILTGERVFLGSPFVCLILKLILTSRLFVITGARHRTCYARCPAGRRRRAGYTAAGDHHGYVPF
jgi:hypothetical protein